MGQSQACQQGDGGRVGVDGIYSNVSSDDSHTVLFL